MSTLRLVVACACALVLVVPSAAQAGTVKNVTGSNTYEGSDVGEELTLAITGGLTNFTADGISFGPVGCTQNGDRQVDCFTTPTTTALTLGGDDRIDGSLLTGTNLVLERT
jgi:hypothetical protein